jgi:hypothetical protein
MMTHAFGTTGRLAAGLLLGLFAARAPAVHHAAEPAGPLQPCGRQLCHPDGTPFAWRGVTAFALVDLIADGREAQARAFVRWAADTGFTVLRVLAMNHGWIDLPPEDGRRALPAVLALARAYGLQVQVVALAGTGREAYSSATFLHEQVRAVGGLCAAAPNCLLELANEPYHQTQTALDDPALMRSLQAQVEAPVPLAWGASRHDALGRLAGGTFVVAHLPRDGDRWARVARMQQLAALSRTTGKFVVDNEPIGAAERAVAGRRDDRPDAFFAQGVLSRIFGVGSTLHCEDCLHARVPERVQQAAARAFVDGATLVPPDRVLAYREPGSPDGPLPASAAGPAQAFAAVSDAGAVIAVLGAIGAPPPMRPGWRITGRLAATGGVRVWAAERAPQKAAFHGRARSCDDGGA